MRRFITLLTHLLLLSFLHMTTSYAQTFVNASATGNNDGSSWTNAYSSLHAALEAYQAGDEIWVAAGTYYPGPPSQWTGASKNTFYLYQDVKLYGGFNGTESMRTERDPASNPTILSGDLNGDDIWGDFGTNRDDNAINVMFLEATISPATIIDGFTIQGGQADGDTTEIYNQRGGGICNFGSPTISNCRLLENSSLSFGAGLYLFGQTTASTTVKDSYFEGNQSGANGGGMSVYTQGASGSVQVLNCQFSDNEAQAGGGLYSWQSSCTVSGCQFSENFAPVIGGAIFYLNGTYVDREFTISDCSFDSNLSSAGGAFYYMTSAPGNSQLTISNTDFMENEADDSIGPNFGDSGAIGLQYLEGNPTNDSITISSCTFLGNTSSLRGGGISVFNLYGAANYLKVDDCQFTDNTASLVGGGLSYVQSTANNTKFELVGSNFEDNRSTNGGGVFYDLNGGNMNEVAIRSCEFLNDSALVLGTDSSADGGALAIQYSGENPQDNSIAVEDCLFEDNHSEGLTGGLLFVGNVGTNNRFEVDKCEFVRNSSVVGFAGLGLGEGGTNNTSLVRNSLFKGNISPGFMAVGAGRVTQIAAPPTGQRTELINCLFMDHSPSVAGTVVAGAHIESTELILTNCTFLNNEIPNVGVGALGLGGGKLTLKNTILQSDGTPNFIFADPGMTGTVESLGGNLISDNSLDAFLGSTDQPATDPLFEVGTAQLSANSSAIDAGTAIGSPTDFDLAGNDRLQGGCIDIGAYESSFDAGITDCLLATSVPEEIIDPAAVLIYPNPATHSTSISIENERRGEIDLLVMNSLGQVMYRTEIQKIDRITAVDLALDNWPQGIYRVVLSNGKSRAVSSFVRK